MKCRDCGSDTEAGNKCEACAQLPEGPTYIDQKNWGY
jgi:methionyl-tRNA synthetase